MPDFHHPEPPSTRRGSEPPDAATPPLEPGRQYPPVEINERRARTENSDLLRRLRSL
jgi:hypothetical protein